MDKPAKFCGNLVAIYGALFSLAWIAQANGLLADWQDAETAPLTALCFVFSGLGLSALSDHRSLVTLSCAAVTVVLLVLNVCLFATGAENWPAQWASAGNSVAITSASATLCLGMGAMVLLASGSLFRGRALLLPALAALGLAVVAVGLLGYIFDAAAIYSVPFFSGLAATTSLGLALLFVGVLLSEPRAGWVSVLLEPEGPKSAALLPLVLVIPCALGYLGYSLVISETLPAALVFVVAGVLAAVLIASYVVYSAQLTRERETRMGQLMRENEDHQRERDLLLREVNHRVKNNLAQIHAMLGLQVRQVEDPAARQALKELRGRIEALGTLHRLLFANKNPGTLCAAEYFQALCERISESVEATHRGVRIHVDVDPVPISLDFAIPAGMLLNELTINAVMHLAGNSADGEVAVSFRRVDGDIFELVVAENGGVKQASASSREQTSSFGMRIVRAMVAQLRGRIDLAGGGDSRFAVRLPIECE